ncbi:MAG: hypothetical protein Q9187_001433 [Circinaria calcarea]
MSKFDSSSSRRHINWVPIGAPIENIAHRYSFKSTQLRNKRGKTAEPWYYEDQIVLDVDNHPVKDYPEIPLACSSQMEAPVVAANSTQGFSDLTGEEILDMQLPNKGNFKYRARNRAALSPSGQTEGSALIHYTILARQESEIAAKTLNTKRKRCEAENAVGDCPGDQGFSNSDDPAHGDPEAGHKRLRRDQNSLIDRNIGGFYRAVPQGVTPGEGSKRDDAHGGAALAISAIDPLLLGVESSTNTPELYLASSYNSSFSTITTIPMHSPLAINRQKSESDHNPESAQSHTHSLGYAMDEVLGEGQQAEPGHRAVLPQENCNEVEGDNKHYETDTFDPYAEEDEYFGFDPYSLKRFAFSAM